MSQGFRIVAWIMRPNGHGPFPVLIVNHDERLTRQGPKVIDQSATSTVTPATPCHPLVVSKRWMLFYPEGRGYAGSDGPKLLGAMGSPDRIVRFLEGRADDGNAGLAWLKSYRDPDVDVDCIAISGVSQGGVVALFASSKNLAAYRATIVQAQWAGDQGAGLSEMMKQGGPITGRILLQHASNDTVAPVRISRTLFSSLKQQGKAVEYKEYDPLPHVDGHALFSTSYFAVWGPDVGQAT
jgi:dienelactone hydrolase